MRLSHSLREEEDRRRNLEHKLSQAESRAASASDFASDLASARKAAAEAAAATSEHDPLRPMLTKLDRKITALEQRKDKVEDALKREVAQLERKIGGLEKKLREAYEDRRGGLGIAPAPVKGKGSAAATEMLAHLGALSARREMESSGKVAKISPRVGGGGSAAAAIRGTDDLTCAERAENRAELLRVQREQRLAKLDPQVAAAENKRRADIAELKNRLIMTQAREAAERRFTGGLAVGGLGEAGSGVATSASRELRDGGPFSARRRGRH